MHEHVFVVPGIGNSGAAHWQSIWETANERWRRLEVADWDNVRCDDWVVALENQCRANRSETIIVAHSLGCLAVAHWASRHSPRIRGALLVAVPDPSGPMFPHQATGFAPLPMLRLPFKTIVVSSSNDPYGTAEHARKCAQSWGAELIDVGNKGHVNSESNLGAWPDGMTLLQSL